MDRTETNPSEDSEQESVQRYRALTEKGGGSAGAIRTLLAKAVALNATDIHINPHVHQNKDVVEATLRVQGKLVKHARWPSDIGTDVIKRFQRVCCPPSLPDEILNGICDINIPTENDKNAQFSMRVCRTPLYQGVSLSVRLVPRYEMIDPDFDTLFPASESSTTELIRTAMASGDGLVMIVGPTASGKSTTSVAAMAEVARPERKVVEVTDTVEVLVPGVQQVQLTPHLSFTDGIKACLRSDVDAIFVDELRDPKSALAAVGAACADHLVVATISARDATDGVCRLLNWGVGEKVLAGCIRLVVSQQLIKRLCPVCASDGVTQGCAECRGANGRVALVETLSFDNEAKRILANSGRSRSWEPSRSGDNYRSFATHAESLILNKITTETAVARVLGKRLI